MGSVSAAHGLQGATAWRVLCLTATCALVLTAPVAAQETRALNGRDAWADSASSLIGGAVARGDLEGLRASRAILERALTAFPNDALLQHYLGYEMYREAALSLVRGSKGETSVLIDSGLAVLERSAGARPMPETDALRSSLLGFRIAQGGALAGMRYGRASSSAMTRALALGPKNPRVWLLRGIGALHTPRAFGGGADKALEYLRAAAAMYADDHPTSPLPRWGENEVYLWLGQVFAQQHLRDSARIAYQRSLTLEPENAWIREMLLPALDSLH